MREPSTNGEATFGCGSGGGNGSGSLLLRSTTTKAAVAGGGTIPNFYVFVL
jgi:hypothetical protein